MTLPCNLVCLHQSISAAIAERFSHDAIKATCIVILTHDGSIDGRFQRFRERERAGYRRQVATVGEDGSLKPRGEVGQEGEVGCPAGVVEGCSGGLEVG
jgi:hypothetical protein